MWEDEDILGIADTYARHEHDFVARNRTHAFRARQSSKDRTCLNERLQAFRERRGAILREQRKRHEHMRYEYEHKLVRKQQKLWLTFIAATARAQRMATVVRGKRAERVSLQVLRALGMHKRRVFRAWAAWVKHRRLLWATTVFKARLRPVVRRFRIASRMRRVDTIVHFLRTVQETNNAVRAARMFYTRILKLQAFCREFLQTTRAQKALLCRQFLRAGLAVRVQGLKRRLRTERRRSEVDRQMLALARRQAQEEERAKGFLRRQHLRERQLAEPKPPGIGHRRPADTAPRAPPPSSGRARRLAPAASSAPSPNSHRAHRPPMEDDGAAASRMRAERHRRRSSMTESIMKTEAFLSQTEEALRSLGVIKRARRKSTVVSKEAAEGLAAAAEATEAPHAVGLPSNGPASVDSPFSTPRAVGLRAPSLVRWKGGGGEGGERAGMDASLEAAARERRAVFRADGDEDTQWEVILAKLLSREPSDEVAPEAAAAAAAAAEASKPGKAERLRQKQAGLPPAPARGRPPAADQEAQSAVAGLPVSRPDDGTDQDETAAVSGDGGASRPRRLSVEMAVMRIRTIEEWPSIPESRLDGILSDILRQHRKQHHKAMCRYREKLRAWEKGFDGEVRKAEARIASIRNRKITKAEKSAIREYLKARCPVPPRFFVLEPWDSMLQIARTAMIEQRKLDADDE